MNGILRSRCPALRSDYSASLHASHINGDGAAANVLNGSPTGFFGDLGGTKPAPAPVPHAPASPPAPNTMPAFAPGAGPINIHARTEKPCRQGPPVP